MAITANSVEELRNGLDAIISKSKERAVDEERLWNALAALVDEIKDTLGDYIALQWCLHHYSQLNKEEQSGALYGEPCETCGGCCDRMHRGNRL